MKNYANLIQQCDSDIRLGQPQTAARRLAKINPARLPREWRLPLAKICRRSGLYSTGLKLLARLIFAPESRPGTEVTPAELAEYAVLLLRSGAVNEAVERLSQVNPEAVPEALLFSAFACFIRWEFLAAIPLLTRYIEIAPTPYAAMVGRTNLAHAFVESGQHEQALTQLEENIRLTTRDGHHQLRSNSHAMRGQIHLKEGRYAFAREELAIARGLFEKTQTNDQFFALKWSLILDGLESKSTKPFDDLRSLAVKTRNWEDRRDADLFSLKIDFVRQRFVHLYFGTPFPGFRERVFDLLGQRPEQPIYVLGEKSVPRFDLRSGEIDGRPALSPGGKCHQLIEVLLRDFYVPLRIGGLFAALFPEERFNVLSSPDRVHQAIRRTRRWFEAEKVPVLINERDGFYSLHIDGPFSIRVPLSRNAVDIAGIHFAKLQSVYGAARLFSVKQAKEKLKLSTSTVHRLVHWGLQTGKIEKVEEIDRTSFFKIAS